MGEQLVSARRQTDDGDGVDALVLERVRMACADLPEVEEAELQGRPLFRVRTKRFAIVNVTTAPPRRRWEGFGRSLHLLADAGEVEALLQDPRFRPSPHHAASGWVALAVDDTTDWDEIGELLDAGYRRAAPQALVDQLDRRHPPRRAP